MEQYFDEINKIILGKKTSLKVSFMLRDVVDLRKNKWVPRHEENFNPKTIDQIHKEAKTLQMQRSQKKGKMHGFYNFQIHIFPSFNADCCVSYHIIPKLTAPPKKGHIFKVKFSESSGSDSRKYSIDKPLNLSLLSTCQTFKLDEIKKLMKVWILVIGKNRDDTCGK